MHEERSKEREICRRNYITQKPSASYLPQVSRVPDGPGLELVQQQRDALEGSDPGPLRNPLSRTDAVAQTRNRAGAQTNLRQKKKHQGLKHDHILNTPL